MYPNDCTRVKHEPHNSNNNNNNHLESWVVPLQSREEFSRWGLLPPILGGISNLVILQTPALPNPRYPALPHQDTSYTWTMVDHCYQLWPLITSLPGYSPNCKDQVSGKNHDFSIGSRSAFWWVGHENRFSATIDHFFNKDFTREVAPDFFLKFGGSLRRRKEKYGTMKKIDENLKKINENIWKSDEI